MKRTLLAAVALLGLLPAAHGQAPPCMPCPPARGASPLLFVRFAGAPGARVTFYRGDQGGPREYEFPVTVGLRPGYVYRVKVEGLPGQAQPLYPTLEVRGSLYLLPHVNPADYPAPFVLNEADVVRVFEGVFLTKVVYLEHPDKAVPSATRPGQLLERPLSAADDLLDEARQYGRPMLVVRVGERPSDARELMAAGVPGTILLPTEKSLPAARVPPYVPFVCVPPYDPVLGPKPPDEECLPDGGDVGHRAGIGPTAAWRGSTRPTPSRSTPTARGGVSSCRPTASASACRATPRCATSCRWPATRRASARPRAAKWPDNSRSGRCCRAWRRTSTSSSSRCRPSCAGR